MRSLAVPPGIEAVIFDMDGVVTDTAAVHAAAWKQLFDGYLRERGQRTSESFTPFDVASDYRLYVDGKPRYDGVRDFLASRGVDLPEGRPDDPPERETVCGLGNRKNQAFLDLLGVEGAHAYASSVELVRALKRSAVGVAIISSSRNMDAVLASAGVGDLFEVRVDGIVADELGLPGKPDPAVFLEAARRLDSRPPDSAIVEDAIAGVEAGRAGGFASVVGVDRSSLGEALAAAGADIVVADLDELWRPAAQGSSA